MLQFQLKSHYKIISDETTKTITVKDPDRTQFIITLKGTEENFHEATYQLLDEAMHYADFYNERFVYRILDRLIVVAYMHDLALVDEHWVR